MRISVPTIPVLLNPSNVPRISRERAIERLADFLGAPGSATLLTGAGVSVESGIRAYRGPAGRYLNPNYQPILYHELVNPSPSGHLFRQRYWLRSYLGYPPVRDTRPNPTHYAFAALQYTGVLGQLVTQNVDGLHHRAMSRIWSRQQMSERMLELHGTLFKVRCSKGHEHDRETFQDMLGVSNPQWKEFADECERTGQRPRTNPDGDAALEGAEYSSFVLPKCPTCVLEGVANDVHKPEVVFFGESIASAVKERSFADIDASDRLLVVGTTLATYSAFRLIKHAVEKSKPVLVLNVGPTRADGLAGTEKLEISTGEVMHDVVHAVLGSQALDPVVQELLSSGEVVLPPMDPSDDGPKAAG